jgi:hypothetical protein
VNKTIAKAKSKYISKRFKDCKLNIRETWRQINYVIGKPVKDSVDVVISKYMSHLNSIDIVNGFMDAFIDGVDIIKHECVIETIQKIECDAMQSMYLRKASPEFVAKTINAASVEKSPGIDDIRTKDLKLIINKISPIIAKLINLCTETGIIPEMLKQSILRPIFKSGDHRIFNNYREIAILPIIEKIMEIHVAEEITNYINLFGILNVNQYGFQKNKSTGQLLNNFSDIVYNALNNGLHVTVVFIDFSKAFDTLLHSRLLDALQKIGIRGPLLVWFNNYLSNRRVAVKFGNVLSDMKTITTGVPQGSRLGPLLYLIYVNEMLSHIKNTDIFLYADDTALVAVHRNFNQANKYLQDDFTNILRWSHDNGLTLNYKKTKVMHIHSPFRNHETVNLIYHDYACLHRNYRKDIDSLNINCGCNVKISNTFQHTYLGVLIDHHFKWDKHIDNICKRLRSGMYSIRILKPYVNSHILKQVYFALIESVVRYGILAWGCTTEMYVNKIMSIQNRIIKIIFPNGKSDHVNKLLNVKQLHKHIFLTANYFSDQHKKLPSHSHSTRTIDTFLIPANINNNYGKQTQRYLVPKIFNELPVSVRSIRKISEIKKAIKVHIIKSE